LEITGCSECRAIRQTLATQDGRRRISSAQSGRSQTGCSSTAKGPVIQHLAPSFRPSGPVEPPESRETRRRDGYRCHDAPEGGIRLRTMHSRLSNSQSQRCTHDEKHRAWRSSSQRHLRMDQPHRPGRFSLSPDIHGRRCSNDIPLCSQDENSKGGLRMLPRILQYFRKR
jgi:hypothetical protein